MQPIAALTKIIDFANKSEYEKERDKRKRGKQIALAKLNQKISSEQAHQPSAGRLIRSTSMSSSNPWNHQMPGSAPITPLSTQPLAMMARLKATG